MKWWNKKNTWERLDFWLDFWFVSMVILILCVGVGGLL